MTKLLFVRMFFGLMIGSATVNCVSAQIKVLTDNSIGLGTTSTSPYKVKLVNDAAQHSIFIDNTFDAGVSDQYGLYNKLQSAGTGKKWAIYNVVHQGTGTEEVRGISNWTYFNGGTSGSDRHCGFFNYNVVNSGAAGLKYGYFNSIQSGGNTDLIGHYNYLGSGGTGDRTGFYLQTYQSGTSDVVQGIKNYTYMNGASTGSTDHIGILNQLWFNGASSTGTKTGIYNWMQSEGTGERYGIINYTFQESASSDKVNGLFNYTGLDGTGDTGKGFHNYVSTSTTTAGTKYGMYNELTTNGTGTRYALYSKVGSTSSNHWAGYFDGNVYATGDVTWGSDEMLKTAVTNCVDGLSAVNALTPRQYQFISDPEDKIHFGFIAQELELVLPQIVRSVYRPGNAIMETVEVDGTFIEQVVGQEPGVTYKGINYMEIIPILTLAIQEQQVQIDEQGSLIGQQATAIATYQEQIASLILAVQDLDARVKVLENQ